MTLAVSAWKGALFFSFYAVIGFGVALGLRHQLATGRIRGRNTPTQSRIAMWGFALIGACGAVLAVWAAFNGP